jgi:hypothetical protein
VGALRWIAQAIILLLILRFVLRLLFGAARPISRRPGSPAGGPLERAGGELVRDPQCGTYVPKASAVVAGAGAEAKYFCSAACRDAYAAKRPR